MPRLHWPAPPWLCISLLVVALVLLSFDGSVSSMESSRAEDVKKIWQQDEPVHPKDLKELRQEAWAMFDFGFSNYMNNAFPKDNLLPISCTGENWQGGIALTLVDALDALLLMNRRADVEVAVSLLRQHLTFDKSARVHVFETVIRELGGLLSAHMLLMRDPSLVSDYDGLFLTQAMELADKLLPAFNTASGLPTLWVNLDGSPVTEENNNITCTACAGTLLLEFGVLSQLTGNSIYRDKAEHAARMVYDMRSKLGLVGGSLDTNTSAWVRKDSSIGPGIDSYYEYLLKAYIMFGDRMYLDMFVELYTASMQHMTLPGTLNGYSFLVDVHMDNGRLAHPWVSSLGAFWPAMQILAGQEGDAVQLHSNFTAAWQMHGWLPEVFNLDLSQAQVHPEDPGYNLRPEHIESTYLLHSYTRDPRYLKVGRDILRALQMNKVKCGFASIADVQTGEHGNIMESFFLSETMKYLYLIFTDSPAITDYYIFSTEGHLLPTFASASDDTLHHEDLGNVPENCKKLCQTRSVEEERQNLLRLQSAFPLIKFNSMDSTTIRSRTCIACMQTTKYVQQIPVQQPLERAAMLGISPAHVKPTPTNAHTPPPAPPRTVLAQLLCTIAIALDGTFRCGTVRSITPYDIQKGLAQNGLVLQLSQVQTRSVHHYVLLHGINGSSAQLPVAPADFGTRVPQVMERCLKALRFSPGNRHGTCPLGPMFTHQTATCTGSPLPLSAYTRLARYLLIRNITSRVPDSHNTQDPILTTPAPAGDESYLPGLGATPTQEGHPSDSSQADYAQVTGCPGTGSPWPAAESDAAPQQLMDDTSSMPSERSTECSASDSGSPPVSDGNVSVACSDAWVKRQAEPEELDETAAQLEVGAGLEVDAELDANPPKPSQSGLDRDRQAESVVGEAPGCTAKEGPSEAAQVRRKRACDVGTKLTWGQLVTVEPPWACMPPSNAAELQGAVAVVLRGKCTFLDKALFLQQAGAVAMLVLNTGTGEELLSMAGDGTSRTAQVHIPSLMVGSNMAHQVLHWLQQYPLTGTFASHCPSAEPGAPPEYTTRVDLLVPVTSQAWIQRIAALQNLDLNAMFEGVLSDAQALKLLWNKARADRKVAARKDTVVEQAQGMQPDLTVESAPGG